MPAAPTSPCFCRLPCRVRTTCSGSGDDASDCAPTASADGARAGADTLTVRHASLEPSAPARRTAAAVFASHSRARAPPVLFGDGRAPGPRRCDHEVRDLEVRTYYIANSSVDRPGWPALRVKALTESRGAAQFRDEEILPGVEDLQVEMGVATHRRRRQRARPLRRAGFAAGARRHRRRSPAVAADSRRHHRTRVQRRPHTDVCQCQLRALARRSQAAPHAHRAHRRAAQCSAAMRAHAERGATLVVGLMLLALVTLLGLAGAATAHIEAQLAHNEQFRENAASAASAGVEYAISRIVTTPAPDSVSSSASATMPGTPDRFESQSRFSATTSRCLSAPAAASRGRAFRNHQHGLFVAPRGRPPTRHRHARRCPRRTRPRPRNASRRSPASAVMRPASSCACPGNGSAHRQ